MWCFQFPWILANFSFLSWVHLQGQSGAKLQSHCAFVQLSSNKTLCMSQTWILLFSLLPAVFQYGQTWLYLFQDLKKGYLKNYLLTKNALPSSASIGETTNESQSSFGSFCFCKMLCSNVFTDTSIFNMERNIIIALILTSIVLDESRGNKVKCFRTTCYIYVIANTAWVILISLRGPPQTFTIYRVTRVLCD